MEREEGENGEQLERENGEQLERNFYEKTEMERLCGHYYYSWDENLDLIFPHDTRRSMGADKHPFGSRDFIGLNVYKITELTDNGDFSDENFIQLTEDGKLYHANVKQESGEMKPVTVKTFGFNRKRNAGFERNVIRFYEEVQLMTSEFCKQNPRIVDVLGVSVERTLSVVYDLKFHKSLYTVIPLHDFGWDDRMKVASQLADVLAAFHDERCVLCVFNSSDVMVDENYNVKLFDLSHVRHLKAINNRIIFDGLTRRFYCYAPESRCEAKYTLLTDVYAFGSVLLELISKVVVYDRTEFLLAERKESLVDKSLSQMTYVATEVAELVTRCLLNDPKSRPTMKEVSHLLKDIRNLESRKKQATC